jgi:uncharacterized membrane protein
LAAVLLALGASVTGGFSDFTGGLVTRRHALLTTLALSQIAGLVFVGTIVAARRESPLPAGDAAFAVLGGVAGLIGIGGLYRGLAVGAMSIVAPLSATAAVVPAIVGLATGEHLGAVRYGGIVLALGGVVLASREPGATARLAAGAAPALLAIAGFGSFFLAIDRASTHSFCWPCSSPARAPPSSSSSWRSQPGCASRRRRSTWPGSFSSACSTRARTSSSPQPRRAGS